MLDACAHTQSAHMQLRVRASVRAVDYDAIIIDNSVVVWRPAGGPAVRRSGAHMKVLAHRHTHTRTHNVCVLIQFNCESLWPDRVD